DRARSATSRLFAGGLTCQRIATSNIVPVHEMRLDGVPTKHHCHGIVDVMGRDVAVRVDILQSLNKSLFGIVDHCCFDMAPDTRACKCGRMPVETALEQRRSAETPMRMTIPPASSLTRMLWPGSSNVFASSAIFGHAALVSGKTIVCS